MRRAVRVLAAGLLLSACVSAPPKPEGRVKAEHRDTFYDVSGLTAEDLYAQMRAQGVRKSRTTLFGEYRWDLSWDYRYDSSWSGGACTMTELHLKLGTQAILPRWQAPAAADPVLQQDWANFVGALRKHEKGHADIAAHAADEIRQALRSHSAADCAQMKATAEKLATGLLRHYRKVEDQYDLDTGYGARQGAIWPPTASR